jgi:hypothetical protein
MGSVRLGTKAFVPCVVYEAHLCQGLYLVVFDSSTTFPDVMEVAGMECPPSDWASGVSRNGAGMEENGVEGVWI